MLTHRNLGSNCLVLKEFWQWQKDDVLLHALPIFHVHGLFVAAHGALINGSKMIWLPRLDTAQLIQQMPRATVMMGVPTFYVRLTADKAFTKSACRNMRLFISGSAPLLTETFNDFKKITGHTILERYGMSETIMLTSNPYQGARVGGSVGVPLPMALRGKSLSISIRLGTLKFAICPLSASIIFCASNFTPAFGTTIANTASPKSGCGIPITALSATPSISSIKLSISLG